MNTTTLRTRIDRAALEKMAHWHIARTVRTDQERDMAMIQYQDALYRMMQAVEEYNQEMMS